MRVEEEKNQEKQLLEILYLPLAFAYYIIALLFLIIGTIGISIPLQKNPIKLFKLLHHSMLVPQTIKIGVKSI